MIRRPPSSPLFPYTPLFRPPRPPRRPRPGRGERLLREGEHGLAARAPPSRVPGRAARRRERRHGKGVVVRNALALALDRKSTRLNSSHSQISYAVFCLKKKK